MLSTMRSAAAFTLALSALSFQSVSASVVAGAVTSAGCFDSSSGLTQSDTYNYQSKGHCQQLCVKANAVVMAMSNGNECWCGNTLPPKSSLQSDSECSTTCVGYPSDMCGGNGVWSVYYTSSDTDVDNYGGGSSSGSSSSSAKSSAAASSSTTAAASSVTSATSASAASDKATVITSIAPGKTVIITQAPASQATTTAPDAEKSHKGGSNTAGIAAGVVVGIVVLAALIGAAFFFWRRKQRRDAETGHQQLNDYSGSSKPMAFRPAAGPDSRIDPEAMAQRRMSDGSIADNEDYSRRILKVCRISADDPP
ncbi:WSC-domain-containing protein [Aureobasidium pullulans]|nr:WSC-domain-containing protein [Aureobasidium pullulans]THX76146.1 WSC-domain-containing protein [Aureobasidium pullulans]THZ13237.1 WSC-domain-containing protein [Aureobasidium pullulans]